MTSNLNHLSTLFLDILSWPNHQAPLSLKWQPQQTPFQRADYTKPGYLANNHSHDNQQTALPAANFAPIYFFQCCQLLNTSNYLCLDQP